MIMAGWSGQIRQTKTLNPLRSAFPWHQPYCQGRACDSFCFCKSSRVSPLLPESSDASFGTAGGPAVLKRRGTRYIHIKIPLVMVHAYTLCFLSTYCRYWDLCVLLLGACKGSGYFVVRSISPLKFNPCFCFCTLACRWTPPAS